MSYSRRRIRPQHGVYALGALCFGLGLAHLATEAEGLGTWLETFVICSIALSVLATGYRLPERPISRAGQWRAVRTAVTVAGSFALLALAVWLIWVLEGDPTEFGFLLAFATTLGSAVGIRGGLYAVEADERLREARDLTKLLTINQRVLRHNLRNELTVALGTLDNIDRRDHGPETAADVRTARTHLESLLETTDRTREIVSIWDTEHRETFRLRSLLAERIEAVEAAYPGVSIAAEFDADPWVESHPALPAAVEEALRNAAKHTPTDAAVTVTLRADRAGTAVVEVTDTGSGIPKFNVDAIESPEETPLVHTQGLGLWIIYWTVETSGGTFEVLENEPSGTVIRMTLPTAEGS
ncbi:HAMP domain-containing sensor histidine kinase [Halorubrum sp. CBA1229]|uniref:sensor histidine kinase n=1 Tax=Halorubrum sp. CBA1229 TaxID=1853699 RepID=UPI0020D1991F|nr:HAMP domain-containing sensor histidine kinase [Halorubrum sp. CBA1229]